MTGRGEPWPPRDVPFVDPAARGGFGCLEDADRRIALLEQVVERTDLDRVRTLAHELRETASAMGAVRLGRAFAGLESAAAASLADATGLWWARVAIEYELAVDSLRHAPRGGAR